MTEENSKKNVSIKSILIKCVLSLVVLFVISWVCGRMELGADEVTPADKKAVAADSAKADEFMNGSVNDAEAITASRGEPTKNNAAKSADEGEAKGADDKRLELPAKIKDRSEIILKKGGYRSSFNAKTLCPNYVCWKLTPQRVKGFRERSDNFHGDPDLREKLRVETFDYSGSGYDRGHMCPAGDNKYSEEAMDESFCMTNVCPQAHSMNKGDWRELEEICRKWAKNYGEVYIACGPIFDSRNPKKIGKRKEYKVSVPDRFFKVVLTMGRKPKAIGFIFPNDDTDLDLRDYAVSVDEVERVTGINFFHILPDNQEDVLESECKPAAWGI